MSLKEKLVKNDITLGSWITLAHPAIAEIMAKSGFDWLTVDLEHSVITIREAEELIRIIELCDVIPLVRLSANDPVQIKRVMDAGAHGVIVPMVNSAAEAEKAVAAVRYPPHGRRGVGLARAQGYGSDFDGYRDWVGKETVVIVQVEHIDAVNNMEEILSVEGVDGFIVGPYDLSGSMGIPGKFEHPLMEDAMERIYTVKMASEKAAGIHIIEPNIEELKQRINQGYSFLAYSLDIRMLDCACRLGIDLIRGEQK
ncbi:MAG: 2,4-dihydroxyhept-2-ene-1,7-dioic acid aldolase [Deltaproteobacteria bacterium]|nr:2,4-dihydroxyhept-2-ene-1,7-dioic acid aldolase [Deltaproteobacteria bacterium]MBW2345397.1 2,4-dihydroxyhept-2-ene-1,7-dioic acid aldolase [Deltaproteobacteria bacterium]